MKNYIWIIIVISIMPLALNADGSDIHGGGHMMGNWIGFHSFWWIVIPFVLLFVIFIFKAYFKSEKKNPDAFEILKIRYAKGEISKEDFEEMKKNLS